MTKRLQTGVTVTSPYMISKLMANPWGLCTAVDFFSLMKMIQSAMTQPERPSEKSGLAFEGQNSLIRNKIVGALYKSQEQTFKYQFRLIKSSNQRLQVQQMPAIIMLKLNKQRIMNSLTKN